MNNNKCITPMDQNNKLLLLSIDCGMSAARTRLVVSNCLALAALVACSETCSWLCEWRQTDRQTAVSLKALFQHMGGLLTIRFCLSENSRNCPLLNCKTVTAINMPIIMTLLVTIVRFNFQVLHFLYYTIDDTAVCTCRMSLLYLTQQSQMLQSITANKVKMLRVYTARDTRHWCLATTNLLPES